MNFIYKYARPAVTVDMLVFRFENPIQILLIKRKNEPFKNTWAFPGGFVDENEPLEKAAKRELSEETGLKNVDLKQLKTFGDPGRDPRGHTVSIAFWGLLKENEMLKAGDDASETAWFKINNLPSLAFDHQEMLEFALKNISELNNKNY